MKRAKVVLDEERGILYKLRKQRQLVETYLVNTRRQVAVWICSQYTYCKKGNCKCTRGSPHGPFHYLFFKAGGKVQHRYIPERKLAGIQALALAYKRYNGRLTRLRRLNRQIERFFQRHQRSTLQAIPQWARKKKGKLDLLHPQRRVCEGTGIRERDRHRGSHRAGQL